MGSEKRFMLTVLLLLFFILRDSSCILKSRGRLANLRDSELNFSQLGRKYGYKTKEHTVVTEDGYILKVFRMRARQCEGKRPPVLLMHGLLTSSDVFLDAGAQYGLAYLLADACYDVWAGNSRGNYYARAHITLNPDKGAEFWNFTYDQMGYYDNPATIDYILNTTGYEKLSYIGHSQGTGIGFIMCSERAGYCDKLNVFINLAPSTRHLNTKSRFSRALGRFVMTYEDVLDKAGFHEILGRPESYLSLINLFCHSVIGEVTVRFIVMLLDGRHDKSIPSSVFRTLCGHSSAGTSLHTVVQYSQAMISTDFRKFDYGDDNIKIYGSEEPPSYNLAATTAPVVLIYGENDGLADPLDARWLASKLPNLLEAYEVPDPKWNHLDFTYSKHIPKLLFPKIKEYLQQYK